ncbi:MAG: 2,3-bisphosphoglycerate-independent phosphoglycerate mutase [Methanomethylovorans sp.]|jgi:2,3-bisphosphoglycerate-independent phosphoglycerate mutase|nr:2,3-bisphosphoglycerate-independent phosphoglycerate mutase [Methanomethylovorans sp.]
MSLSKKPLVLIILDGWGYNPDPVGNAVLAAKTPVLDSLIKKYPSTFLEASGESVGLPTGQMGNSEVGHLNIGAGRIVYQDLTRINRAIESGAIYENSVLKEAINNVKVHNSNLHLMGLFSYGGVHSHMNHLKGLIDFTEKMGISKVYVHAFLDGRDVPPRQALDDMEKFQENYSKKGNVIFATISGRYYAMDRDKRWDRTKLAYNALVLGEGIKSKDPILAIKDAYKRGETDEFVQPTVIINEYGQPVATVKDNDSVIFFNFRPDRARQLTYSFVNEFFEGFERKLHPHVHYVCMSEYDEKLDLPLVFPPECIKNTLGEVLSKHGLKQLRIAETEKYAHVTFFLNGGVEQQNAGEDRLLIPSPKISTYDLKPQMSAYEITDELVERLKSGFYDVIIVNYANMDMVGHTGLFDATVEAVQTVDTCVGKVVNAVLEEDGSVIITADHGNAEKMIDPVSGAPHTAHTSNPVRCIYVSNEPDLQIHKGKLSDIAPTMLEILEIPKPVEMTGMSLLKRSF